MKRHKTVHPRKNTAPVTTTTKGKGSPYSITERRVPEQIPVLGSQPAGYVSHKPGGRLPLLSARPAVTLATLKRADYQFRCSVNRGTMGVNSLPKTVTRQRRECDLNPGPSAPESSTLATRLPSHPLGLVREVKVVDLEYGGAGIEPEDVECVVAVKLLRVVLVMTPVRVGPVQVSGRASVDNTGEVVLSGGVLLSPAVQHATVADRRHELRTVCTPYTPPPSYIVYILLS